MEQRLSLLTQQQMNQQRTEQDLKVKVEELTTALRQQDTMMRQKDEETVKLREDNSNMFKDLREFADNEQSLK